MEDGAARLEESTETHVWMGHVILDKMPSKDVPDEIWMGLSWSMQNSCVLVLKLFYKLEIASKENLLKKQMNKNLYFSLKRKDAFSWGKCLKC